jgi:long-chain acyl-CoA synthetase
MDVTPYLELRPAPQAVFDRAAAHPDASRFMVPREGGGYEPVSWQAFADEVRRVAAALLGVIAPGERVAVLGHNSVAWAASALGVQAAGGVMVPIYPASTAAQIRHILAHSEAAVALVDPALLARLAEVAGELKALREVIALGDATPSERLELPMPLSSYGEALARGQEVLAAAPDAVDRALASIALDEVGLLLYTSGTSGAPKGVPLTHRNVGTNARDWLEVNAPLLREGAVDLLWLPMSHIFGLGELCLGNTLGFTSYLATPADVLDRLPEVKPEVLMSVPAYWEKLAAGALAERDPARRCALIAEATGGRLRFCLSGGAGLRREVKELFYACGVLIIEGYGLTECSPTLTLNRPDAFRFDTVGKPLPSVELRLAEDGEILARGPNVFAGYHHDPEATREAFTDDGFFRTGDIGELTSEGFLRIVDRKKDILVTAGGKNVAPANVEMAFRDDPLFEHVVVYGDGRKYLVAAVWLSAAAVRAELGDAPRPEAVRARVSERVAAVNAQLARFETIKAFVVVEEPLTVESGLLTTSLKVRRKHVYARFREVFEGMYTPAPAPRTRQEAIP